MNGYYNPYLVILAVALIAVAVSAIALFVLRQRHFAARNACLADSLRVAKEAAESALLDNRRINEQLRTAQTELLGAAHRAGMAQIANNVLHNIGNVLNSVNVSAGFISARRSARRMPPGCCVLAGSSRR